METTVKRYTEEEKRRHVERMKSLGVSQKEYCRMNGIAKSCISSCKKNYDGEEAAVADAGSENFVRIGRMPRAA